MKCVEFGAQDVSFGALHFTAIDMGGEIKLNVRTQRALGSENDMGGNQFAIKNIAMGSEWIANKHHSRIPSRNRVDLLASEFRMGEYQRATVCYDRVSKPSSLMKYEMWPNAHDSMNTGHGRNFKNLGWLLQDLWPAEDFRIRVFDIECDEETPTATVYQYSERFTEIPLGKSLNLAVWSSHLRFLQPSRETFT